MRSIYSYLAVVLFMTASVTAQDSTFSKEFSDGPYVYWQNDSTARVFYVCSGSPVDTVYAVEDTLLFRGFGTDSINVYSIPRRHSEKQGPVFQTEYPIAAISDIHGDYDHLIEWLKAAGVVDSSLHWDFDKGHLVILGDVFDRGSLVTEILWLIYRLQQEAERAGGMVHMMLGNHEKMALRGDLRYVHPKYLKGTVRKTRIPYDELYGPAMELGKWLRSASTTIKINDLLFVHGGISPELLEKNLSLEQINRQTSEAIDYSNYRTAFDPEARFMISSDGPLWSRDYFPDEPGSVDVAALVQSALDRYDASTIVVGHSGHEQVQFLYDNRLIAIDVWVEEIGYQQGALWKDGRTFLVSGTGEIRPVD